MEIDVATLGNEQLVELIHVACAEAITRGTLCLSAAERELIVTFATARESAVQRAAQARRLAEETTARLRREAEQREHDEAHAKEAATWAKRKGIAQALALAFGSSARGWSVRVWQKPDASHEKRIYVNGSGNTEMACFYATGNRRSAPGTLALAGQFKERRALVLAFCKAVAKAWNALRVDADIALAWEGEASPLLFAADAAPAGEAVSP